MAKVVYNACHGGFGLSEAAVARYAELKGAKTVDVEFNSDAHRRLGAVSYAADGKPLNIRTVPRHDPALVQTVEELGEDANGLYADLRISEVTDGGRYRIDEYDGMESVETPDDIEWIIAA